MSSVKEHGVPVQYRDSTVIPEFQKSKKPANLNYHMSIKKSQAILKRFIDLKLIVWFTLVSENETTFIDT